MPHGQRVTSQPTSRQQPQGDESVNSSSPQQADQTLPRRRQHVQKSKSQKAQRTRQHPTKDRNNTGSTRAPAARSTEPETAQKNVQEQGGRAWTCRHEQTHGPSGGPRLRAAAFPSACSGTSCTQSPWPGYGHPRSEAGSCPPRPPRLQNGREHGQHTKKTQCASTAPEHITQHVHTSAQVRWGKLSGMEKNKSSSGTSCTHNRGPVRTVQKVNEQPTRHPDTQTRCHRWATDLRRTKRHIQPPSREPPTRPRLASAWHQQWSHDVPASKSSISVAIVATPFSTTNASLSWDRMVIMRLGAAASSFVAIGMVSSLAGAMSVILSGGRQRNGKAKDARGRGAENRADGSEGSVLPSHPAHVGTTSVKATRARCWAGGWRPTAARRWGARPFAATGHAGQLPTRSARSGGWRASCIAGCDSSAGSAERTGPTTEISHCFLPRSLESVDPTGRSLAGHEYDEYIKYDSDEIITEQNQRLWPSG